jgi:hypothetical protein
MLFILITLLYFITFLTFSDTFNIDQFKQSIEIVKLLFV